MYRNGDVDVTWLTRTAPAIGLAEHFQPRTESITFSKGDSLLLYTDGVTEVFNYGMEQFGQDRLAELIKQNANLTAPGFLQSIRQALNNFGDNRPLVDDVTLISLKVLN